MAIQFLGGTTAENDSYVGPARSLTIDIERWEVRVHDGETVGGYVVGSLVNLPTATTTEDGLMSSEDKSKLDNIPADAEANTVNSVAGKTGDVTLTPADIENLSQFITLQTGISRVSEGEYSLSGNLSLEGSM